jgi:hypothetical protein
MNDMMRLIPEVSFNIFYLIFIWALVYKMYRKTRYRSDSDRGVGYLLRLGFLVLAIGDTGHVGFRLWAYALGSVDSSVNIIGMNLPLIGSGALSTAILVTVFYLLMVEAERRRFNQSWNPIYILLMLTGLARFIVMALPGNEWGNAVPPAEMSLYRNIPLTVLGLGLGILMLVHARRKGDRVFTYLSVLIFISYAFYIPVILFVQKVPMIGMLMIPKTIAYLLMALSVYRNFFKPQQR